MACYCPRIRCFNCDEYSHVAVDCPTRYLHQVHLHAITNLTHLEQTGIDQPLGIAHGIDKDSASPDLTHAHITTEVIAMKVSTDVAPSPPTDILTGAHYTIANPAQGTTAMICHLEDHSLHIRVPLHIQEIKVTLGTQHPIDQ